jgi:hypothetical protein
MSKEFACATCGKDLLFELPQSISRWDSATDTRVFCSGDCITASAPPADCVVYKPDPEAAPVPPTHWQEYDL